MRTFGGFRSGDHFFYGEVRGDDVRMLWQNTYWLEIQPTGEVLPFAILQIDLPVAPSKLIAVGLNYADHIAEMKRTPLGTPLIWFKAPTSLLAHKQAQSRSRFQSIRRILKPSWPSSLARARKMSASSRRVILFLATPSAKTSATAICRNPRNNLAAANRSTPTPRSDHSSILNVDVADLEITLRQNGEVKQRARTSQMIYSVADIVSFASQNLTLLPGDVILTGTPSGVGPIRAGDELEARIGDWPPLLNRVRNAGQLNGKICVEKEFLRACTTSCTPG